MIHKSNIPLCVNISEKDVIELVKEALLHGIHVEMLKKPKSNLTMTSDIQLHEMMTISEIHAEVVYKMLIAGVNPYSGLVDEIRRLVKNAHHIT